MHPFARVAQQIIATGNSRSYDAFTPSELCFPPLLPRSDTAPAGEQIDRLIAEAMVNAGWLGYTETTIPWDTTLVTYESIFAPARDASQPNTSQEYFLDLIHRIDTEINS